MNSLPEIPTDRMARYNRSAAGFTPLTYLDIILRSAHVDSRVVPRRACQADPEARQAVDDLLPTGAPLLCDAIDPWAEMLGVPRPDLGASIP